METIEQLTLEEINNLNFFRTKMVKCIYKGDIYEALFTTSADSLNLISSEALNENSIFKKNVYFTEIKDEYLSEIIIEELFYKYNGNLFKVLDVLKDKVLVEIDFAQENLINEEIQYDRNITNKSFITLARDDNNFYVKKNYFYNDNVNEKSHTK